MLSNVGVNKIKSLFKSSPIYLKYELEWPATCLKSVPLTPSQICPFSCKRSKCLNYYCVQKTAPYNFFNLKPQCKWHINRRAKILLTRQFKWCLMKEKSSHFESCHFGLNIKRQQNEHIFHHFNQCNQNFHRMTVSESFSVNIFTPFLNPTRGFNLKRHFRKRGRAPK